MTKVWRSYGGRMTASALAALLLHILLLWLAALLPEAAAPPAAPVFQEPLELNLAKTDSPKTFIDAPVPARAPVNPDTDLIATQDANASDLAPDEGEGIRPDTGDPADYDDLGGASAPLEKPVKTKPENWESPEPQDKRDKKEAAKPPEQKMEVADTRGITATKVPSTSEPKETKDETETSAPEPLTPKEKEPADPIAPSAASARGDAKSKVEGGVKNLGFVGFEAKQSEIAAYLAEVRRSVEAQWKALLQVRYTGRAPTEAVVDCIIQPDGRLLQASIVDAGNSPTYGALCKQAMEKAAPFPEFPFEVPGIYRTKNLEIRWTFSYETR